jgi:hypothetical protein
MMAIIEGRALSVVGVAGETSLIIPVPLHPFSPRMEVSDGSVLRRLAPLLSLPAVIKPFCVLLASAGLILFSSCERHSAEELASLPGAGEPHGEEVKGAAHSSHEMPNATGTPEHE